MKRHVRTLMASMLTLVLGAAAARADKQEAGEAGAKALLDEFLKPGANAAALSKQLRPSSADYKAVFGGALAKKAEASYKPGWDKGAIVIQPREGQTELKLWSATTEELQSGGGNAKEFPGGYAKVAAQLGKGLTFYRFKFVAPGQTAGLAFDGLVFVNGHWVIFPKPFRVLEQEAIEKLE